MQRWGKLLQVVTIYASTTRDLETVGKISSVIGTGLYCKLVQLELTLDGQRIE